MDEVAFYVAARLLDIVVEGWARRRGMRFVKATQAPPPAASVPLAIVALGLGARWPYVSRADVDKAYRRLAFDLHPDRGGNAELFKALNEMRARAIAAVREHGWMFRVGPRRR